MYRCQSDRQSREPDNHFGQTKEGGMWDITILFTVKL